MNLNYEVHETHAPLWEDKTWRYALLMGGRGNGRSGSASRYTISRLVGKEYTRGAIMRAVREDIRASSWQALNDRLIEEDAEKARGLHIVDGDMNMKYGQNSIKAFGFRASSGSLTARLKSLEGINYAWIEEGEEIVEEEFMKFDDSLRTVKGRIQIVITLNTPHISHWIIKRWFNIRPHPEAKGFYILELKPEMRKSTLYIPGTWRENEVNMDEATVERYKKYKETKPAYYWQVIEGLAPEVVQGKIYSDWKEIDEVPHEARLEGYGLDFGFDPDPAAIIAVYYYNGGYILDQIDYGTQRLNRHLATTILNQPDKSAPVICDHAEPKSIAELRELDVNAIPCEKGRDSVRAGIKQVQGMKISFTSRSKKLKHEYENYHWKINKDGEEESTPEGDDHAMDAARYALTMIKPIDPVKEREKEVERDSNVRERRETVQKDTGL